MRVVRVREGLGTFKCFLSKNLGGGEGGVGGGGGENGEGAGGSGHASWWGRCGRKLVGVVRVVVGTHWQHLNTF